MLANFNSRFEDAQNFGKIYSDTFRYLWLTKMIDAFT